MENTLEEEYVDVGLEKGQDVALSVRRVKVVDENHEERVEKSEDGD